MIFSTSVLLLRYVCSYNKLDKAKNGLFLMDYTAAMVASCVMNKAIICSPLNDWTFFGTIMAASIENQR